MLGAAKTPHEVLQLSVAEVYGAFNKLISTEVIGHLVQAPKGPEGSHLCFKGLAVTLVALSPDVGRLLLYLNLSRYPSAQLTVDLSKQARAQQAVQSIAMPEPTRLEALKVWVEFSESNVPSRFDPEEAEEFVVRLVQRYLLLHAHNYCEKVSVLAGRINHAYLRRKLASAQAQRRAQWWQIVVRKGKFEELLASHGELFLIQEGPDRQNQKELVLQDVSLLDPNSLPPSRASTELPFAEDERAAIAAMLAPASQMPNAEPLADAHHHQQHSTPSMQQSGLPVYPHGNPTAAAATSEQV